MPRRVPQVPLPGWGKLDHHSGWREFAAGAASAGVADAIAAFHPQVPSMCNLDVDKYVLQRENLLLRRSLSWTM